MLFYFILQEVETGAVKLRIEYDDEWNLTVEVIEADIIPQDESKEKEGKTLVVRGKSLYKSRTLSDKSL